MVIGYQVPKDSLTVRFADGTVEDISLDTCSCGGTPCRRRAESELLPVEDAAGGSVDDAALSDETATLVSTPAEPERGETEPSVSADTSTDVAADAAFLSQTEPDDGGPAAVGAGEPDPGDAGSQGEESAPRRRSRRRRRRPRPSGDGGNPTV